MGCRDQGAWSPPAKVLYLALCALEAEAAMQHTQVPSMFSELRMEVLVTLAMLQMLLRCFISYLAMFHLPCLFILVVCVSIYLASHAASVSAHIVCTFAIRTASYAPCASYTALQAFVNTLICETSAKTAFPACAAFCRVYAIWCPVFYRLQPCQTI